MLAEFMALLGWGMFWGLLCLGLCAPGWATAPRWLGRAAVACGLHAVALSLPSWYYWAAYLGFDFAPPAEWLSPLNHPIDWTNKVAGLLVCAGLLYGLHWVTPAEAGLARPRPGSLRVVAPVVLAVAALVLTNAYLARHDFAPLWWKERLFYTLVPGLEEELFYRGILLALLSRAFAPRVPLPGTRTSWGGLVSVGLFVLAHNIILPISWLVVTHFQPLLHLYAWLSFLHFSVAEVLFQCGMGLLFLWVRARTGSVWAAMAAHCLVNGGLALGPALG